MQGKCEKCGAIYYGWALQQKKHRKCACGGDIKVKEVVK